MSDIINKIILDVSLDERVSDGIFDIYNNTHMEALREYLVDKGISEDVATGFSNLVLEKGKHPERQAYNSNGILVTFPTPEYKQRAIQRGTHFEINPKVAQSNLFGGGQQAPSQPTATPSTPTTAQPQAAQPSVATASDKSALPPSDTVANKQTPPAAVKPSPTPQQPPTAVKQPTSVPDPSKPAQGQLAVEPPKQSPVKSISTPEPVTTPVVAKTPKEQNAEKEVIKQVFNSVDSMPTVPGVGGSSLNEQLAVLTKFALDFKLNDAAKFLSKYL